MTPATTATQVTTRSTTLLVRDALFDAEGEAVAAAEEADGESVNGVNIAPPISA